MSSSKNQAGPLAVVGGIIGTVSVLLVIVIGLLFSVGAFKDGDATADIQNVVRVTAGTISALALAGAIEFVVARRRSSDILDSLETTNGRLAAMEKTLQPPADSVLMRREQMSPWTTTVQGCDQLSMSGLSLRTFTKEHLGSVRRMLQQGGACRFLLLEPYTAGSKLTAWNFLGQEDATEYDAEISASLARLAELAVKWPERVEVRVLDHIPAASITLLRTDGQEPAAFVELYTEEESSVGRPHLQLTPSLSPLWFQYFDQQFEILWTRAHDWPKPTTHPEAAGDAADTTGTVA